MKRLPRRRVEGESKLRLAQVHRKLVSKEGVRWKREKEGEMEKLRELFGVVEASRSRARRGGNTQRRGEGGDSRRNESGQGKKKKEEVNVFRKTKLQTSQKRDLYVSESRSLLQ